MRKLFFSLGVATLLVTACNEKPQEELTLSGLNPENFRTAIEGKETALYTLKNPSGMEVCITNFGGRIVSVMVPDREGTLRDVVLGFDNIEDYIHIPSDFGASIGRYANRINQGKITLNGEEIQLPQNNFGHTLHGGPNGWQYKVYDATQLNENTLELVMNSPDGDENFPGNLTAKVTYTLTDDNSINILYQATTDKTTVINMTNHSYFNLSGNPSKPVTDDILYINADYFTPVDDTFMTTGEILPVKDTPMDFTTPKRIGDEIDNFDYDQLKNGNGYDHNWILNDSGAAARVSSPETGIYVEVYTNEPGIQVYTGNFLDGTAKGKKGIVYNQRVGICLETQHYPDSPNKPEWPSVILEPGDTYFSHCVFKFGIDN